MGTLLQDALSKRISIREGDAVRKVSRAEAMTAALPRSVTNLCCFIQVRDVAVY
jgi:hypothetical protein